MSLKKFLFNALCDHEVITIKHHPRIVYCTKCHRFNIMEKERMDYGWRYTKWISEEDFHKQYADAFDQAIKEAKLCDVSGVHVIDDVSDGYHKFGDLYNQRLHLFALIVNILPDLCCKSKRHFTGEECFGGGWFLVTIKTPDGQYGYHFEEEYWDMFHCKETETGPEWDGYTESDVDRLLDLEKYSITLEPTIRLRCVAENAPNCCTKDEVDAMLDQTIASDPEKDEEPDFFDSISVLLKAAKKINRVIPDDVPATNNAEMSSVDFVLYGANESGLAVSKEPVSITKPINELKIIAALKTKTFDALDGITRHTRQEYNNETMDIIPVATLDIEPVYNKLGGVYDGLVDGTKLDKLIAYCNGISVTNFRSSIIRGLNELTRYMPMNGEGKTLNSEESFIVDEVYELIDSLYDEARKESN